ncbi:uncharacterized protein LOC112460330 [Temnothorax curvispinosus]|uniref:Uncharacterized protein LOC112460330 n=2 Tax=Temnothorax TaxID=300110 RepID=A0A6J1QJK6_9HYME|nr:uncharacterized protein LOC112460330 [Temnothorax curvispinosus]TGZ33766.1 Uncharacterized protein DBV15_07026 [Temnothorax longispinosus]
MLSRVNLVALLLTLNCVSRAIEHSRSPLEKWQEEGRAVTSDKKVLRYMYDNVTSESPISSVNGRNGDRDKVAKIHRSIDQDIYNAYSKIEMRDRDETRRRKRKVRPSTMMALLMAYKLKFVALIPTILGGLILLKGTTLLAGFFFALFAAVLGLKVH